jgi:hypothetical protein
MMPSKYSAVQPDFGKRLNAFCALYNSSSEIDAHIRFVVQSIICFTSMRFLVKNLCSLGAPSQGP